MRSSIFYSALFLFVFFIPGKSTGQLKWEKVDSLFQPLPASVHVFKTTSMLDGKSNIAYYVEADLKDEGLFFTTDTSLNRRLTPSQFHDKAINTALPEKDHPIHPLVIVNTTFFSFETNKSLNIVIKDGKRVAENLRIVRGKGKDSVRRYMPSLGAIGINKRREADIAWIKSDTTSSKVLATQKVPEGTIFKTYNNTGHTSIVNPSKYKKWKMVTAVVGGLVLMQDGDIRITNEEERMFAGKAINDKHPRTAIGYTKDNKLIILVVEGRHPGIAEGATLIQLAQIFKELGCHEALNLDGGGSSCMLVNGKETIKVSDAKGQRPVPAVFMINWRK